MPTTRRYCTRVLLMASSCSRCTYDMNDRGPKSYIGTGIHSGVRIHLSWKTKRTASRVHYIIAWPRNWRTRIYEDRFTWWEEEIRVDLKIVRRWLLRGCSRSDALLETFFFFFFFLLHLFFSLKYQAGSTRHLFESYVLLYSFVISLLLFLLLLLLATKGIKYR